MKKLQRKALTVPPDWIWIAFSIILFLILLPFAILGIEVTFPRVDNRLLLFIVFCTFIQASVYYTISPNYLYVKVLGFSLRKIAWSEFSGATYLCNVKTAHGNRRPHCILLSLKPVAPFRGNATEEWVKYKRQNRMKYILLNLPSGKDDVYISTVEAYLQQEIIR